METPTPETRGDPWLLTPGPLTTAPEVKSAMMRDLGSRDDAFVALSERVRERYLRGRGDAGHLRAG
jgi:2-aminoethylphosphonate-pyruvate transaminase